ncbi:uncharacterized protein LOC130050591 [Ostrea edulis]|uniref:uncharacterized protein LOC130050591 n=1 Tax=Ostrea edulis TaxID=37623 RepID=UPI0024AF2B74|nr:uncharacterized protein LOC130050591 [Ostrea edulis]
MGTAPEGKSISLMGTAPEGNSISLMGTAPEARRGESRRAYDTCFGNVIFMLCIIMRCTYNLVWLLNGLLVISDAQTQIPGDCSHKGDPLQCCRNYKRRVDACEECWPGTFGIDCKEDCPDGFYGRLYAEVCDCSSCDKVSGCQPNSTQIDAKDINRITETTKQENSYNRAVIIASLLTGSLTFIIIVIVIYRKQSRNRILISPDSSINEGGVPDRTTPFDEFPQLSPSSSNATDGGGPASTFHGGNFELSDPQMCWQENDFADNLMNSKDNSHAKLSTLDSDYSHLNMDMGDYNRLSLTIKNSQETDEDYYSAQTSNSCWNNTEWGCSSRNNENGCLLTEKECSSALNKYSQREDMFETPSIPEQGNFKISMTKKDGISSVKGKINPMYLEELSRKLNGFKPKAQDIEFNYSV